MSGTYLRTMIFSRGSAKRRKDYEYGAKYANVHSLRCKLLADNMESLGTSFSKTFKVERGHFGSCVSLL